MQLFLDFILTRKMFFDVAQKKKKNKKLKQKKNGPTDFFQRLRGGPVRIWGALHFVSSVNN